MSGIAMHKLPFQHPLTDTPVQVISLRELNSPSSYTPHRHSFYMLLWVTNGQGLHRINYREYEQKAGQVYLLHDGDIHQVLQYPEDGWLILFKPPVYEKFLSEYPNQQYTGVFDPNTRNPFVELPEITAHTFKAIIELMQQEADTNPRSMLLNHYLSILLVHTNRQKQISVALYYSTESRQIQKLKQLIGLHYREHRHVYFYSTQLGMTARKLNEVCKRSTGRLVHELVAEKLLCECEALLGGTDLPVKEIIYQLGFIDHSHFAYFFRQNRGTTPSDYRKRLQG